MSIFTIRAHKRFAVCRKVRLNKERRRGIDGLLIELSLDGCRISHVKALQGLALDDLVRLAIPGMDRMEARVRWLGEGAVGLRFAQPLHNAALEALVRLCRSEAQPVAA